MQADVGWSTFVWIAVALLLAVMFLGHIAGQPAVLGYVETDSMSPALEAGDGFVAVPSFLSPGVSVGDVVVFEAREIQGGGLTTHRVVGETDGGYVTKGDANPFTDQDGGEPPVSENQVKAKALQLGGGVVGLPGLGTAVSAVQSTAAVSLAAVTGFVGLGSTGGSQAGGVVLLLFGVALLLLSTAGDRERRTRRRDTTANAVDGRKVAAFVLVAVLLPANLAMLAPSGVHEFETDVSALSEQEIQPGDSVEREITARNQGLVAMLVVLEPTTSGASVDRTSVSLASGDSDSVTVSTEVPESGAVSVDRVSEHRYFVLLPPAVLERLHRVHPLLALAAVNAVLGVGVLGLVGGLFGFGKLRFRDTSRKKPLKTRLRRAFR